MRTVSATSWEPRASGSPKRRPNIPLTGNRGLPEILASPRRASSRPQSLAEAALRLRRRGAAPSRPGRSNGKSLLCAKLEPSSDGPTSNPRPVRTKPSAIALARCEGIHRLLSPLSMFPSAMLAVCRHPTSTSPRRSPADPTARRRGHGQGAREGRGDAVQGRR
jgi:hypothetical protein